MDRKLILPISLLTLAVLILFLPVMTGWKGIFHDTHSTFNFLINYFTAQNLQKGIIPLWDPHVWCGAIPYYAFIYSSHNYYFPSWPFYLLADLNDLDKAYWMLNILPLFLHYLIAAIGMFFLCRKVIKCNLFSSFVASIAYIYGPSLIYTYVKQSVLEMLSWLPWFLYFYVLTLGKFKLWKLFLSCVILYLIWTSGAVHYVIFVMIIWLGFILHATVQNKPMKNLKTTIWPLVLALMTFILGTALSFIYLYSVFDGTKNTQLSLELNPNAISSQAGGSLSLFHLAALFLPNLFGGVTGKDFIGSPLMFYQANMSGGIATTLAVLIGAYLSFKTFSNNSKNMDKSTSSYGVLCLILYVFSIICMFGNNTPFYKLLIGWIPFLGGLPYPIRYRTIQCFSSSILLAIGLNYLTSCKFEISKTVIQKLTFLFFIILLCFLGLLLFLPQNYKLYNNLRGNVNDTVDGFFPEGNYVGVYTPTDSRTKKIRVAFDGPSEGEIRYSNDHASNYKESTLEKKYIASKKGYYEFDVDIPPNKFLWIEPKSGIGRLGYSNERIKTFVYDKKWTLRYLVNGMTIYLDDKANNLSWFDKFLDNQIIKGPFIFSFWHWIIFSMLIVLAIILLSPKNFGYFLGLLIITEFFTFGMMAFYDCTFIEKKPLLPQHIRYKRPSDHTMLNVMTKIAPTIATDPLLRLASDYPVSAKFFRLTNRSVFMDFHVYPIESRFKRAFEKAYEEQEMTDSIAIEGINFPSDEEFLDNFSVGYYLDQRIEQAFLNEKVVIALQDTEAHFIHVNASALPRIYTLDKIIATSEEDQLEMLISDDLRKAVTLEKNKNILFNNSIAENPIKHFNELQRLNKVSNFNTNNPNKIELDIDIKMPSMLVLTDIWYPGWKAYDNKKETTIYRVNYCQRGIWLEEGTHHIKMEFKPKAWYAGATVSFATLFLFLALFPYKLRTEN